jgi:hypothetical protein
MSSEAAHQLPDELRQELVEAVPAWLEMADLGEVATKRHFSADETSHIAETHNRVVQALRRILGTDGILPAIRFRGTIFALASHPESLVVVREDEIRPIDG